jgi:hypothetical protein
MKLSTWPGVTAKYSNTFAGNEYGGAVRRDDRSAVDGGCGGFARGVSLLINAPQFLLHYTNCLTRRLRRRKGLTTSRLIVACETA